MGTGKTVALSKIFALDGGLVKRDATVLMLVYRRTLSTELHSKMHSCGFQNYLDLKTSDLYDKKKYPRIICQLDSLDRLCEFEFDIPSYDYIVIDEVESVLNHIQAKTIVQPYHKMIKVCLMLQGKTSLDAMESNRPSILLLDALYGSKSYLLIKDLGLSQRVLQNNHITFDLQRQFTFSNWKLEEWMDMIIADVSAGLNIIVVTLSNAVGQALKDKVMECCEELEDEYTLADDCNTTVNKVLYYSSKMDDKRKKDFARINTVWARCRLVIYSPTIESGKKENRAKSAIKDS